MNDKIREKLNTLPDKPGSYQMLDSEGRIIYVGKAKNLKKRVRSYFIGAHNDKTTALVSKIDDFNYITTKNETEAYLLEISLIKEYEPFYNIALTDDKTYPYIEYTKEANPKLIITRNLNKKNTRYFGPYPNVISARETLELINRIYKIRRCKKLPNKPCIYYELGECSAPCINKISKEEYDKTYQEIKSFLNGTDRSIIQKLKKEMADYSEKMDFENAKKTRDLIRSIESTITKENVILKDKISVDIYGIKYDHRLLGCAHAVQCDIGCLMILLVAAHGLAQNFRGAGNVQDVVLDLERKTDLECGLAHFLHRFLIRVGQDRPDLHRSLQKGSGL